MHYDTIEGIYFSSIDFLQIKIILQILKSKIIYFSDLKFGVYDALNLCRVKKKLGVSSPFFNIH